MDDAPKSDVKSLDGNLHAAARNTSLESTNLAKVIEQYEPQEIVQGAWEQNYYEMQKVNPIEEIAILKL